MVNWYKQLVPVITITALLGTGAVANAVSDVEQAVLIPGATVFKPINPQYPIVAKTYPVIGIPLSRRCRPAGGRLLAGCA